MFYGENKPDEFGMTSGKRVQEFVVLLVVFLMLFGCFMKVIFL